MIKPLQLYVDSVDITRQVGARAYGESGDLLYTSNIRPELFSWRTSAPDVLSVDATGLIWSLGWGTATVTATHEDGLEGSTRVKVRDAVDLAWALPVGQGSMQSSVVIGADGTIYAGIHEAAHQLSRWMSVSPAGVSRRALDQQLGSAELSQPE